MERIGEVPEQLRRYPKPGARIQLPSISPPDFLFETRIRQGNEAGNFETFSSAFNRGFRKASLQPKRQPARIWADPRLGFGSVRRASRTHLDKACWRVRLSAARRVAPAGLSFSTIAYQQWPGSGSVEASRLLTDSSHIASITPCEGAAAFNHGDNAWRFRLPVN